MAVYKEFPQLWFTLQALRAYHGDWFDLLVVDNAPERSRATEAATHAAGGRYVHRPDLTGTSRPRDAVFRLADTEWVLCCDAHVLFEPGSLEFFRDGRANRHPHDLVSGPMVSDDGRGLSTHWRPTTPPGLWGVWDHDRRADDPAGEPFEIPMQGLGAFAMRRGAWVGFHPLARGFGGEEGYLHEKVRRAGGRAVCVPALRWRHLFRDPSEPVPYSAKVDDHARNLVLQHRELGIEATDAIHRDFGRRLQPAAWDRIRAEGEALPFGGPPLLPRLNVLGVWYSDNTAPEGLLRKSLETARSAQDWANRSGQHAAKVIAVPWSEVGGTAVRQDVFRGEQRRSHAAIVGAIRQAVRTADSESDMAVDVVCCLEHDVLYPPDYFTTVADTFGRFPAANVVSNLDYIGLSAQGWQPVKERHEPLHQLSFRAPVLAANLDRAAADCERDGWCLLEPQGDRPDWVRVGASPGLGVMPSVHVNHIAGRFTGHGDVCYGPAAADRHPHWGEARKWWPA